MNAHDDTLQPGGTLNGGAHGGRVRGCGLPNVGGGGGGDTCTIPAGESAAVELAGAVSHAEPQRPSAAVLVEDAQRPGEGGAAEPLPPLTDRGVEMTTGDHGGAASPPVGRLDYLKITVWADALDVLSYLRMEFIDRYIPWDAPWVDQGPAKRIARRWQWAGQEFFVLEYKAADFVSIELKGTMCVMLGDEALRVLLVDLAARWRWRVTRLDYAWDAVPFDVMTVKAAIEAGNVSSRCRLPSPVGFQQDPRTGGRTVYFPRFRAERFIRVYDYRGPVRLELQLGHGYAEFAGITLTQEALDAWPRLMMGWLRNLVDFVDRSSGGRADRCPLIEWWRQFVCGVPKLSSINPAAKPARHILGQVERTLSHSARMLEALRRAFLPGTINVATEQVIPEVFVRWLMRKVNDYAMRNWDANDDARVRTLRVWRSDSVLGWEREVITEPPI